MPRNTDQHTPSTTLTERLCEGVIEAGWLACLAVTPLLFNAYGKQTFEVAKVAGLRSIVMVMIAAWLTKVIAGGRPWLRAPVTGSEGREASSWRARVGAGLGVPLVVPAIAICASYVLSTALSVDPRLSLWGSPARFQGLLTQLAPVVVFALVLMHLRTWAQWRRAAYMIIITSVPVALYAVIQRLGMDPIVWPEQNVRVSSTLGNPIFLGAYLMMAMFITVREAGDRFTAARAVSSGASRIRRRQLVHAALLVGVVLLQLAAFVLAQSRGPLLGLAAGGLVLFPVGWLLLSPRKIFRLKRPRWSAQSRRTRRLALITVVLGLTVVLSLALARPQLVLLAERTGVARLATPLSFSSVTAETRMLIWRGALEIMRDQRPLSPAHGEPDPRHRARSLIGYGPETFGHALNRHLPPRLVLLERPGDTPDRAHNGVLDQLVATGLIGFVAWTSLYCAVFFWAARWLGLLSKTVQRIVFFASLSAGALIGVLAPVVMWHKPALSAPGGAVGAVLGLAGFIIVSSAVGHGRDQRSGNRFDSRESLVLTVLALTVAHLVELQFGIALIVTSLYLWFMIAVLVVAGLGWFEDDASPLEVKGRRRASSEEDRSDRSPSGILVPALLVAFSACCLIFGFSTNWSNETRPLALVQAALLPDTGPAAVRAVLWFCGWLAAMLLARHLWPPEGVKRRTPFGFKLAAASLVLPGLYLVLQANRLTWTVGARQSGVDVVRLSEHISWHFPVVVFCLLGVVAAAGTALAREGGKPDPSSRAQVYRAIASVLLLGAVTAGLIVRLNLDPVRAEVLLKHGQAFAKAGRAQLGFAALDRAAQLAPSEPLRLLLTGRVFMAAASEANSNPALRSEYLVQAERALARARTLSPLDPDHTANIARCLVVQAAHADSPRVGDALRRRAAIEYEEALRLRPIWPQVVDEFAPLLRSMGRGDTADELERRVAKARP